MFTAKLTPFQRGQIWSYIAEKQVRMGRTGDLYYQWICLGIYLLMSKQTWGYVYFEHDPLEE